MNQPPATPPARRSMLEAIKTPPVVTAEIASFIKAGTPKPQTPNPVISPELAAATHKAAEAVGDVSEIAKLGKPKSRKEVALEDSPLVGIYCRVPQVVAQQLLKVSVERKLKKLEPFTQQAIAGEAIQEWLTRHGCAPDKG